ncbi:MAG TPA: hypothetical protein VKN63_01385 [Afifellaceae bacterium]|nr:hypothetical protein [Afifellaceae bacterium]
MLLQQVENALQGPDIEIRANLDATSIRKLDLNALVRGTICWWAGLRRLVCG